MKGMRRMPVPKHFKSSIRVTVKERTLSQLQEWIIDGTLKPGEKLNDAELAEALGVSRTPVREALQLLEVHGFVEMHPGKETRVTTIQKEDIFKLYPPLAALQALAAEIATSMITPKEIKQLREINTAFAKAVSDKQPFKAMEIDEQFHNLIVELADNPYIEAYTITLQMHIRRLKYVFLQQPKKTLTDISIKEHEAIIEAFERNDSKSAAEMMKKNWQRPMEKVNEII